MLAGAVSGTKITKAHVAAIHAVAKDGVPAAEVVAARHALIALAAAQAGREQHAPSRFHALTQFAGFHHFSGDIATQNMRHGELHAGNSGAHEQIEVVQRTRTDAHQDLVGLDFRIGNIFVYQYIGRAVLMDAGGFHPSQYNGPRPKSSHEPRGLLFGCRGI